MVGVMTAKALAFAARQAVPRRQPSRRPCAVGAAHRGRGLSLSAAAGLGWPLPAPDGAGSGRLRPARHDDRRCGRRMLRQDGEAPGPRLSRWAGRRAGGARAAMRSALSCRGRCGRSPAANFSFSGLKTAVRQTIEKLPKTTRARSPISVPLSSAPWAMCWSTAAPTRSHRRHRHPCGGGRRRGQPLPARPSR